MQMPRLSVQEETTLQTYVGVNATKMELEHGLSFMA
jgi:hypothetical protein